MQDWTIQQDSLLENIIESMSDQASSRWTGEQKLQFAILIDAGMDLDRLWRMWERNDLLGQRDKRLWKESIEWFFASEEEWPFSFLGICSSLKLRPQRIREHIQQLHDEAEGAA